MAERRLEPVTLGAAQLQNKALKAAPGLPMLAHAAYPRQGGMAEEQLIPLHATKPAGIAGSTSPSLPAQVWCLPWTPRRLKLMGQQTRRATGLEAPCRDIRVGLIAGSPSWTPGIPWGNEPFHGPQHCSTVLPSFPTPGKASRDILGPGNSSLPSQQQGQEHICLQKAPISHCQLVPRGGGRAAELGTAPSIPAPVFGP